MDNDKRRIEWLEELATLKRRKAELEKLIAQEGHQEKPSAGILSSEVFNHQSVEIEKISKQIPVIYFIKDLKGSYLNANQAYCDLIGTTPEQILGRSDFELVEQSKAERYHSEDQRILSASEPSVEIIERIDHLGQSLIISYRKLPIKDGSGSIVGLIGMGFDISELVQTKEELKQERRLIRTIIDIIPDQIFVRDRQCRFILNNKSDAQKMGVSDPESLVGKSDDDYFPPALAAQYQADDRMVMETGQSLINQEEPLIAVDGQEYCILTSKVPLYNDQKQVIGLVGISRDITERKRAEQQLIQAMEENRASRNFLQNILDTSPSYIRWKDKDLRYLGCNQAFANLFNLQSPEEVIGKSDFDFIESEEIREAQKASSTAVLTSGHPEYHIQENIRDKDGNLLCLDTNKIPLRDLFGEVIGILIFSVDITLQKTIQDQIQQLNLELESFSYSVSHDLRAPLRHINSFSSLLKEDYADHLDATAQDYLEKIILATQQMSQLIENLLRLSRVTRGNLQISEVDLREVATGIFDDLRTEFPDRKVEIVMPERMLARADEPLMRIVLKNLIDNAWKFTSKTEHAIIEMGSMEQEYKTVYYIRDNGAGFDMKFSSRIFDPFQRLHTDKEFSGTGVGLALVKRIISRHGGAVWANAEVDRGAVFYFSLE